jgi:O-antigen/teichoic acid export membrane protein
VPAGGRTDAVVHQPLRVGGFVLSGLRARLLRGVGWSLVGTAFQQGSTFACNVILANLWALPTFGKYAIVQSTLATVVYVAQVATGYTATKYLAEFRAADPERAARLLGLCAIVASITGVTASVALVLTAPWLAGAALGESALSVPLMVAGVIVAPAAMNAFMMGALAGLEAYPSLGKVGILSGVFNVTACVIGAWTGGVAGAFAGLATSAIVQFLVLRRTLVAEARRHQLRFSSASVAATTRWLCLPRRTAFV